MEVGKELDVLISGAESPGVRFCMYQELGSQRPQTRGRQQSPQIRLLPTREPAFGREMILNEKLIFAICCLAFCCQVAIRDQTDGDCWPCDG